MPHAGGEYGASSSFTSQRAYTGSRGATPAKGDTRLKRCVAFGGSGFWPFVPCEGSSKVLAKSGAGVEDQRGLG